MGNFEPTTNENNEKLVYKLVLEFRNVHDVEWDEVYYTLGSIDLTRLTDPVPSITLHNVIYPFVALERFAILTQPPVGATVNKVPESEVPEIQEPNHS